MKTKIIFAGVLIFVAGGVFWISQNQSTDAAPVDNTEVKPLENTAPATPPPTKTADKPVSNTPAPKAGQYTLADIGKHANSSSCFTAINGGVYDLTAWISGHPGGEGAILSICGKDGSSAFNNQHGGAAKQAEILVTFKIGVLIK